MTKHIAVLKGGWSAELKLFATTPKQMIIRYIVGTVLLVSMFIWMWIMYRTMFGSHFMCTEGVADDAMHDCIFWADIGEFIAESAIALFSLFQVISFFRFILLKTNGSKKLLFTKIVFVGFSAFFLSSIIYLY